jgi:hypothetical protein
MVNEWRAPTKSKKKDEKGGIMTELKLVGLERAVVEGEIRLKEAFGAALVGIFVEQPHARMCFQDTSYGIRIIRTDNVYVQEKTEEWLKECESGACKFKETYEIVAYEYFVDDLTKEKPSVALTRKIMKEQGLDVWEFQHRPAQDERYRLNGLNVFSESKASVLQECVEKLTDLNVMETENISARDLKEVCVEVFGLSFEKLKLQVENERLMGELGETQKTNQKKRGKAL